MEGVLRGQEIFRLKREACSYEKDCFYFPIRHHSPACSYHLKKVIEAYSPDCILIEGPDNANELLGDLLLEGTQAPFAIYYSYRDEKGLVSEQKERYRCYYPFLDYSPELVALREGYARKTHCAFIDLPYEEILIAGEKEDSYNDDRYLMQNRFVDRILERSRTKSSEEFWEKYFEIQGLTQTTQEFLEHMLLYCVLSRANTSPEELRSDACLAREAYMRKSISDACRCFERVLVVTGGFHVAGLVEDDNWLKATLPEGKMQGTGRLFEKGVPESLTCRIEAGKPHSVDSKNKGVYLMSYSMEATDRLNGYASGMPHPMFYQRIWEGIAKGEKENVYEQTILQFLVEVGKQVRQKEGYPSAFDEICALVMCRDLAALRGKKCAGVYELTDSVLSNYVKGEYNLATDKPMRELQKALTGKKIGKLADGTKLPPLCQDFEALTHTFRLDIHSSTRKEVTLSIFSTQKHRDISCFFYRMEYLETGFARRKKGPNLRLRKDRNLIREIWEYRFGENVMSALVEASVYGGTLSEACRTLATKKLMEETDAGGVSALLVRMFEMGLAYDTQAMKDRLEEVLQSGSDFFSLAATFSNLSMLSDLSGLYRTPFSMETLKEVVTQKLLSLLLHMTGVKDEETQKLLETLKELYRVLLEYGHEEERRYFTEVLWKMKKAACLNASIAGAVHGILYVYGEMDADEVAVCMKGYLQGTQEKSLQAADYIRGLFFMARDILFAQEGILTMLDEFVKNTEYENFIRLLPQLRLAFSYFTPMETDRLAAKVAAKYSITQKEFKELREVSKEEYDYGRQLEKRVLERMGMKV